MRKALEMKGIAWVRLISDVIWARARVTCIAQHSGPKAHIPTSQRTTLKSVPAALVRHSLRKLQLWNGKYQYIHYALYIYTFILMLLYNPCILLLIVFLERRCKAALDWHRDYMFVEWVCKTDRERAIWSAVVFKGQKQWAPWSVQSTAVLERNSLDPTQLWLLVCCWHEAY